MIPIRGSSYSRSMAPKRKRIQNPAMANGTDGKGAAASSSTKEPGAGVTAGTAQQAVGQLTAAGQDADVEQAAKKPKVDAWDGRLPSKDAAEDAMHTMQHIIPKVKQTLPQALAAWAGTCNSGVVKSALYEVQPLAIKDKISDGEITSFKAPWETQKCLQAVATTGLYEAAVNICWLDAQKTKKLPFDLPMERPAWSTVYTIYERQFSKTANGLGGVTPDSAPRLYFPVPLPAFVLDPAILQQSCFNEGLVLSGGHAMVLAWFLGMHFAIELQDEEWIRRLWECGLTVTVRVRKATPDDPRNVILDSLNYSEACQVAKLASKDSFSVFTQKLHAFTTVFKKEKPKASQDAVVKYLAQMGVRFMGANMNTTMYKMAKGVHDACNEAVRAEMERMEWKYGPELLSSSYNKVGRMVQTCQKVVQSGQSIDLDEALTFVLQMMDYCVATGKVRSAKSFTMDVVDRQKDGSQGWFGTTLNKMKFLRYFEKVFVESLKENNEALWNALQNDVLPGFRDPLTVITTENKQCGDGAVGVTTTKLSPVASQVNDMLLQVFQGEFDPGLKAAPLEQHIRETFASCENEDHFMKPLRDALESVQRCAATMAVVPGGNKKEEDDDKTRSLGRNDSCVDVDCEEDARTELEKKCSKERKKHVQFVTIPKLTKRNLDDAYASSGVRQIQTAKDNQRGFFFCADLIAEHPTEPWLRAMYPDTETLKQVSEWKNEIKGPQDWIFMFDGRNREIGNTMLSQMQGRQHLSELMLLYSAKGTRIEAGRTRKVALASSNVERLLLYPPCARTALTAKPRENFNVLGESSTHDITYSGIPKRSRQAMPRITEEDKKSIFDGSQNQAHGVPDALLQAFPNPVLFWQESKPVELFEQLLLDFDIRVVFDVSPGSGCLAEAALRLGICYVGVTTKATHAKWLGNVMDRVAMSHVVTPGRPCYLKDVAADVQTYFGAMLAGLKESADMEDVDLAELLKDSV